MADTCMCRLLFCEPSNACVHNFLTKGMCWLIKGGGRASQTYKPSHPSGALCVLCLFTCGLDMLPSQRLVHILGRLLTPLAHWQVAHQMHDPFVGQRRPLLLSVFRDGTATAASMAAAGTQRYTAVKAGR